MKNIFKKLGTASNIALFTFCYSYNVLAAPGTLVQSPLFLTNTVEPNIYFTYDDSNSMGYETVIDSDFVIAPDFVTKFEIQNGKVMMDEKNADGEEKPIAKIFYSDLGRPSYKGVIPPKSVMTGTWVFRTHYSNSIYYNPNQTYETWKMAGCEYSEYTTELNDGKLELNVPATPPPPTDDACSRATAATYNLLEPRNYSHDYDLSDNSEDGEVDPTVLTGTIYIPTYYTWHDDDGDGVMDPREGTKIEIKEDTNSYSHDGGRTDCASTTSCTFAREIQNFSNWFVFNRSREGVAKAALAEVIINSDSVRMALEAMHTNDSGSPLTELVSMDDNTKNAMLTALYSRDTYAKTPTREALKRVGDRFKDITNGTVILSAKEGGACQQNFNILVTDGFWTGSNHDGDDATDFTFTTFPNADAYSADNAFDGNAEESNDGGNYADTHENTLADVAMYYYKTDLRPEGQPSPLENLVPVPTKGVTYRGEDKPNHQHLVTYAIGFGLEGSLDTDIDPTHLSFGGWPDPDDAGDIVTKEKNARVDDLWHAAYNSRGLYFSASNSAELSDALKDSIEAIAGDTATATAAAVNVSRLAEGSKVYFTEFNSDGWYGTIDAHNVVEDGNFLTLVDSGVSAAERLAAKTIADRVILTYDADNSEGVEFKLPDNATDLTATDLTATDLTAEMKADLHTGPNGEPDGLGVARLQYIRGDHTKEVSEADGYLRQRPTLSSNGQTSVLGDIVHSSPVYVGTPDIGWPDVFPVNNPSKPYSEFVSESTRSGVIYAGANDGMLHGFDSTTLEELMAYIPSNLFSSNPGEGLHYLTEPDYNHRYYVDLTPSISDVFINGAWHTILVGGQRAGGKGYFALDITDPDSFGTDDVMWEFTHADLGYTYSQPQIGMMNDGSWVAIFGNGYNN
ncbi:MAG: hypothetical protein GY820_48730, partial [Gammaproteobacteria bacterium]|nr:hypothetical protein [Gammaproteobacteria bacterium]